MKNQTGLGWRAMDWQESGTEDGVRLIALSGDIDLQHSPRMRELLQTVIADKTSVLLMDFSGVSYIDSSGLATLVEYYQNSRAFEGRIGLFGLSDRVESVFGLVRLNQIFSIFKTEEDARTGLL